MIQPQICENEAARGGSAPGFGRVGDRAQRTPKPRIGRLGASEQAGRPIIWQESSDCRVLV